MAELGPGLGGGGGSSDEEESDEEQTQTRRSSTAGARRAVQQDPSADLDDSETESTDSDTAGGGQDTDPFSGGSSAPAGAQRAVNQERSPARPSDSGTGDQQSGGQDADESAEDGGGITDAQQQNIDASLAEGDESIRREQQGIETGGDPTAKQAQQFEQQLTSQEGQLQTAEQFVKSQFGDVDDFSIEGVGEGRFRAEVETGGGETVTRTFRVPTDPDEIRIEADDGRLRARLTPLGAERINVNPTTGEVERRVASESGLDPGDVEAQRVDGEFEVTLSGEGKETVRSRQQQAVQGAARAVRQDELRRPPEAQLDDLDAGARGAVLAARELDEENVDRRGALRRRVKRENPNATDIEIERKGDRLVATFERKQQRGDAVTRGARGVVESTTGVDLPTERELVAPLRGGVEDVTGLNLPTHRDVVTAPRRAASGRIGIDLPTEPGLSARAREEALRRGVDLPSEQEFSAGLRESFADTTSVSLPTQEELTASSVLLTGAGPALAEPTPLGEAAVVGTAVGVGLVSSGEVLTRRAGEEGQLSEDLPTGMPDSEMPVSDSARDQAELEPEETVVLERPEIPVEGALEERAEIQTPEGMDDSAVGFTGDGELRVPDDFTGDVVLRSQSAMQRQQRRETGDELDDELDDERIIVEVPDEMIPDEEVVIGRDPAVDEFEEEPEGIERGEEAQQPQVTEEDTLEPVEEDLESTIDTDPVDFQTEVDVRMPTEEAQRPQARVGGATQDREEQRARADELVDQRPGQSVDVEVGQDLRAGMALDIAEVSLQRSALMTDELAETETVEDVSTEEIVQSEELGDDFVTRLGRGRGRRRRRQDLPDLDVGFDSGLDDEEATGGEFENPVYTPEEIISGEAFDDLDDFEEVE